MRLLALCLAMVFSVAPATPLAKNVILFVGDGMGISTVTAARIYAGQLQGKAGEEHELSFDRFDHVALIKTYNVDSQVPDSAGTITALLSGEKTRIGLLGVGPDVMLNDCEAALANELPTLLELAEEAGKATGIVTTTRVTHATPAGTYAHSANRNWEDQVSEAASAAGCRDIARQLIEFPHGDGVDVVFGGGRGNFMHRGETDPEYPTKSGRRTDTNLIDAWRQDAPNRRYAWNKAEFDAFEMRADQQYIALFEPSHMQFEADRKGDPAGEPSLKDMTLKALDRLTQEEAGYFLLVEAGRIDHAHHFGNAYRALVDTVALDEAVAATLARVDLNETLVIVTADHSHTLTISGYPTRGNPILGKVAQAGEGIIPNEDKRPYTTLGYANGPGYRDDYPDLTDVDTQAPNYQQIAAVPLAIETHAGEDVAAFAVGRNADAVRGVMEQNRLFPVMLDALFLSSEASQ